MEIVQTNCCVTTATAIPVTSRRRL